jgi:hypothetical protein
MEQEYKYKSAPPIAKYKKLKSGAVEMLIRHNLRMKIPENVIQENMKYNFYFFNGIKEKIDNEKAYLLTNEKHFELINTLEKD